MKLSKIGHVILVVRDLERSLAFYRDVLGMGVRYTIPGFAFLDGGGVILALRQVEFSREPRVVTSDATHDLLATDFRDPDGHVLSITGRGPRAPGVPH